MSQNPRTESVGPGGERPPGRIELLAGGTELANRFEVREVLGTGGYAVVYRAERERQRERERERERAAQSQKEPEKPHIKGGQGA